MHVFGLWDPGGNPRGQKENMQMVYMQQTQYTKNTQKDPC